MIRDFIRNSSIYLIIGVINKAISIVLLPLYVRFLTTEEYGLLDLILLFANFINLTFSLELTQSIARSLPNYRILNAKKILISTNFWIVLTSYIFFLIIYLTGEKIINTHVFSNQIPKELYSIIGFYVFLNGIFMFLQNNLRWDSSTYKYLINSVLFTSSKILLLMLFLNNNIGFKGVLMSFNISLLISIIYILFVHKNYYRLLFSLRFAKKSIKFSFPLIFSSLSVFFTLYIDRILISQNLNLSKLAVYAVSYKIGSVITILSSSFSSAFLPIIYKNPFSETTKFFIREIFKLFIVITFMFLIFLSLFIQDILLVLTSIEYVESKNYVLIIASSIFLSSLTIFFPGLIVLGKTRTLAIVNFTSVFLNFILGFFLIKKFELFGIAYSTLISSAYYFLINFYLNYRDYSKKIDLMIIIFLFMSGLIPFIISEILSINFSLSITCIFMLKIFLFIIILSISYQKLKTSLKILFKNENSLFD